MTPLFIPEPKQITFADAHFALPRNASIGIASAELYPIALAARALLPRAPIHVVLPKAGDALTLTLHRVLKAGGYRLAITPRGIVLQGRDVAAARHGLQTLTQLMQQAPRDRLPCLRIDDWPDFQDRGVYYDVARGRVPKLERLFELADHLARYKINHLQLYIEHTFAFRGHPRIGSGASPLTAEDILQLDEYCAARGIELVPSLASFGHLATVLHWPEYRHLAEDWGIGKFTAPTDDRPAWFRATAWTLSPANPDSYSFLDSLFAEFLPLFRSRRFNICCDETLDLGLGQSYEICRKKGKGVVYLDHIKKVRALCRKYGKSVMFWGDIIRHYPALIKDIPKDVTVLDWGYDRNHPFERIKDFKVAGLPFYACPGTSGWVSLFNRLPEASANIAGFAAVGAKHGALGLLNTDWGDGGHYNFMEFSWHGFLCGAEQGWNVKADQASFTRRFARLFLHSDSTALVDAITSLGDVAQLGSSRRYQSVLRHIFFATPDDDLFSRRPPEEMSVARRGVPTLKKVVLNAARGRELAVQLAGVRKVLVTHAGHKGVDPLGVLPYWIFAVDTLAHAARKLEVLAPDGRDTTAARRALKVEMRSLMKRFQKLWLARNRPSEIRVTLGYYRKAIRSL